MKQKKISITVKELIIRVSVLSITFSVAYYAQDSHKQILNVFALLIAFFGSLYLHKHFFPLFVGAILCYLTASVQELWDADYTHLRITNFLWTVGNILLPFAIIDFIYRLIFKYKITNKDG